MTVSSTGSSSRHKVLVHKLKVPEPEGGRCSKRVRKVEARKEMDAIGKRVF